MSIHETLMDGSQKAVMSNYLENLALLERLHRLLLDVVKDEFERLGVLEINSVQALLLFNIQQQPVQPFQQRQVFQVVGHNRLLRPVHQCFVNAHSKISALV